MASSSGRPRRGAGARLLILAALTAALLAAVAFAGACGSDDGAAQTGGDTEVLRLASPDLERRSDLGIIAGEVPSAIKPPSGCRFHPRCPFRMEICDGIEPEPHDAGGGRLVACHLPDDADLSRTGKEPA